MPRVARSSQWTSSPHWPAFSGCNLYQAYHVVRVFTCVNIEIAAKPCSRKVAKDNLRNTCRYIYVWQKHEYPCFKSHFPLSQPPQLCKTFANFFYSICDPHFYTLALNSTMNINLIGKEKEWETSQTESAGKDLLRFSILPDTAFKSSSYGFQPNLRPFSEESKGFHQGKEEFLGPRGPLRTPSFARPFARPRQKSKSPLEPYKSSQDHARPPIWNIAAKGTMSSIKRWWRIQRQQKQRQRQWQRRKKFQEEWVNFYRLKLIYICWDVPCSCPHPLSTSRQRQTQRQWQIQRQRQSS